MIKLAIFDLDGTLLNTLDDLAAACNRALRLHAYPQHPAEAYKTFVGNGAYNLIRRALPEDCREEPVIARVKEDFSAYYAAHAQDATRPYDGIPEMLRNIREGGAAVAVLSNKPHAYTLDLVADYFPGLIDLAFGQREGGPIKPDPAGVEEILAYFGFPKEQCIYIGDSGVDMQTGNNAGLCTIGVSWGFRTKEELKSNGAHNIVHNSAELTEYILDI